jgi:DNA-binding transcriptional regulator LsrR (DeoR family)
MTNRELKKISLLAEVACDYYERGFNQDQIAERLCLSRTRVSRLLKEAMEKKVVQFTINYTFERHYEMEERLKNRFSLKNALVLNNRNHNREHIQRDVGKLAAGYIMENLKEDMIIGTSWGATLADTISFLQPIQIPIEVVQLVGAVPCKTPGSTPQEIAGKLASILGGHAAFLHTPLFIEDHYARNIMRKDKNNAAVLEKGAFADMVLTSVGDIAHIRENEFWQDYMTDDLYEELRSKEAVGSIFAHFFDQDGKVIDCTWNKCCIALRIEDLKEIPNVVVIAASKFKAGAVLAAIRGGMVKILITDGTTATEILRLNSETSPKAVY